MDVNYGFGEKTKNLKAEKTGFFNNQIELLLFPLVLMIIAFYFVPSFRTFIGSKALAATVIIFYFFIIVSLTINLKIIFSTILSICIIALLYYFRGYNNGSFIEYSFSLFLFWFPLTMYYYITNTSVKMKRFIFIFALSCLSYTSLTTIINLVKYPMASRQLATGSSSYDLALYSSLNIGGYDFIYSLVIMIPILMLFLRFRNINPIVSLAITCIFIYCIISSQYATAILLALFSLVFYFINFKYKRNFIVLICILFVILLFQKEIIAFLINLSSDFKFDFLSIRMQELADSLETSTAIGGASDRISLYQLSITRFFDNIFFGKIFSFIDSPIGGHSEFFDLLATLGLFGFLIVYTNFNIFLNDLRCKIKNKTFNNNLLITYFIFFLICVFNTVFTSPAIGLTMFLIVPLASEFDEFTNYKTRSNNENTLAM